MPQGHVSLAVADKYLRMSEKMKNDCVKNTQSIIAKMLTVNGVCATADVLTFLLLI